MATFTEMADAWIASNLAAQSETEAITRSQPIGQLNEAANDPAAWREPFDAWLRVRCLNAPRWFTAVYALHGDYCDWEIAQNGVPCTRDVFLRLLTNYGYLTDEANGSQLVSSLALRQDVEDFNRAIERSANEDFDRDAAFKKSTVKPRLFHTPHTNACSSVIPR